MLFSASTADQPDTDSVSTRWIGFIDRVTLTAIEGWAHDAHNPDVPVTVEVVTSKGKRVAALAHMYRKDVEDAGFGAGICGFFLDLSKLQLTDESAIVRFAGSKYPLTKEPISFDPGRAVLTTDMPSGFLGLMGQLAAETRQAAEIMDATT